MSSQISDGEMDMLEARVRRLNPGQVVTRESNNAYTLEEIIETISKLGEHFEIGEIGFDAYVASSEIAITKANNKRLRRQQKQMALLRK